MKTFLTILLLALAFQSTWASLYEYPQNKRPEVSLSEAIEVTNDMLKARDHEQKYHIVGASLLGDKDQSGGGAWTLFLSDTEGNQVWAHIQLKSAYCSLTYYPRDQSEEDISTSIEFDRNELNSAEVSNES